MICLMFQLTSLGLDLNIQWSNDRGLGWRVVTGQYCRLYLNSVICWLYDFQTGRNKQSQMGHTQDSMLNSGAPHIKSGWWLVICERLVKSYIWFHSGYYQIQSCSQLLQSYYLTWLLPQGCAEGIIVMNISAQVIFCGLHNTPLSPCLVSAKIKEFLSIWQF